MSQPPDPKDFIITRKRKKYKFALFANSPLCFELEQWTAIPADVVEVGAGTGYFSVELASRYPEKRFVALDVKADRLQHGAALAAERGLTNINFVRARADQLEQVVIKNSVSQIWLTFPDPFPRKRSAGRRLSNSTYLYTYTNMLALHGELFLKHDSQEFFQWSLEQLVACGWGLRELSFDLHESEMHDDYKIQTTYETKWLGEGLVTNFVRAQRPAKAAHEPSRR